MPLQRSHGDWVCRKTGALPRHEVSFKVYTTMGFVCLRTAIGFMAFILMIINAVFSDNRITVGRQGSSNYSWETVGD